jgi:predicted DNA-binding WGR domain protein
VAALPSGPSCTIIQIKKRYKFYVTDQRSPVILPNTEGWLHASWGRRGRGGTGKFSSETGTNVPPVSEV